MTGRPRRVHIEPEDLLDSDILPELRDQLLADLLQEFDSLNLDDKEGRRRVAYCRWAVKATYLKLERMLRDRK